MARLHLSGLSWEALTTCLLLGAFASGAESQSEHRKAPTFVNEPPDHVAFTNNSVMTIQCSANGDPAPNLVWVHKDGGAVETIQDLREVFPNGTLLFHPFRSEDFRPDIHNVPYRCVASNSLGSIVSRLVHVRAVVLQHYAIQVHDVTVLQGNAAILQCNVPLMIREFVEVTSWIRNEDIVIETAELTEDVDSKHTILPSGELFVRDVQLSDNGSWFKCQTHNRLTGESRTSNNSGRLIVTRAEGGVAPKIAFSKAEVTTKENSDVIIPCVAEGNPTPEVTWYARLSDGLLLPIHFGGRMKQLGAGLLIQNALVSDSGAYVCDVKNGFGNARGETAAVILEPLSVMVHPRNQTVDVGTSAVFRCTVSGHPITAVRWMKNGEILDTATEELTLSYVKWSDAGIYQCFAENSHSSAQAVAQLMFGDVSPEFLEVFGEESFHPGANVTLTCSAISSPPSKITWYLDDRPLEDDSRYELDEFVNSDGAVVSILSINNTQTDDGGVYRCVATNKVSHSDHSARLNVYGPISIRPMKPVSAVTGHSVIVHCPVYGYPITSIKWWKDGEILPQNLRQSIYPNGTLVIADIRQGMDPGRYTCVASNQLGEIEEEDIQISVLVAPKIIPFSFQDGHLFEGVLARVACVIFQGDRPLTIRWTKDGHSIPFNSGISINDFDEYSSILTIGVVTPKHSGNYTCTAKNHAAVATHTAELIVNVPPRWKIKPVDTTVIVGEDAFMHCQAEGFPALTVSWMWSNEVSPGAVKKMIKRDDKYHLFKNGTLLVQKATETQQGYYFCQAVNNVGPSISAVAYLAVKFPARLDTWQTNLTVHHGKTFILECRASGDFPMNFTWNKGGIEIPSEQFRYIVKEVVINHGMLSELTVPNTKPEDAGVYGCMVENLYGMDSSTYFVTVQEKPKAPSTIKVNELGSRFANVSWIPPFDGYSKITSYTLEYKKAKDFSPSADITVPDNIWEMEVGKEIIDTIENFVLITNLQPASGYYLRIFANNEVGTSESSPTIVIQTKEEAPSGPPKNISVETINSKTLKICWKPPDIETWNGALKGYWVGHKVWGSTELPVFKPVLFHNSTADQCANITGLRKFIRYAVVIQAYNDIGRGPGTDEIMAMTAEGVPTESAINVVCDPKSSQSIHISWQRPHMDRLNGILRGYKVFVSPSIGSPDGNYSAVQNTTEEEVVIERLEKFTNYSFRITAYTRAGDGTPTSPVICRTMEDVPGPPAAFRAMIMAPEAVLVAWKPPLQTNGIITQYNIHMREEWQKSQGSIHWSVPNDVLQYDIPSLKENQKYSFWVTASTSAGAGERSSIITLTPKGPLVPAQAITFDDTVQGMWQKRVTLPCKAVGIPEPTKKWFFGETEVKSNAKRKVFNDGTLLIKEAQGYHSGNYTCLIKNKQSKDRVKYYVTILAPPSPPNLVVSFTTRTSIHLEWIPGASNGAEIKGYTLKFRSKGPWDQVDLEPDTLSYELTELQCGTIYEINLFAFNDIGKGDPSDTLKVATNGSVPQLPHEALGIEEGATFLTVHLEKAVNGDCPIDHYMVEYKPKFSDLWVAVDKEINSSQKTVVISDLHPATWYKLRLMARSNSGTATAEYDVATLGIHGGTVNPNLENPVLEDGRSILFYIDLRIVIPIAACIGLLLLALIIMCVCVEKKKDITQQSPRKVLKPEKTNNSHLARRPKDQEGATDSFTYLKHTNVDLKRQKSAVNCQQVLDGMVSFTDDTSRTNSYCDGNHVCFNLRPTNDELTPYATYHLNNGTELQTFQQRTSAPAGQVTATDTEDETTSEHVKLHGIQQFSRPKSYTPGYANVLAESPSTGKKKLRQVAIPTAPVLPALPGLLPSRRGSQGSQGSSFTPYQHDSLPNIAKTQLSRPATPSSASSTPALKHKPLLINSEMSLPMPSPKEMSNSTSDLPRPEAILPIPLSINTDVSPVYSNVVDSKDFMSRS